MKFTIEQLRAAKEKALSHAAFKTFAVGIGDNCITIRALPEAYVPQVPESIDGVPIKIVRASMPHKQEKL